MLSFEYDSRANESVAYVGGDDDSALYRVRMVQDDCPENPFTSWDGHWPMIVDYRERGHNFTEYGDVPCPIASMTNGQLIRHQKAILSALGDECSNGWHSWSIETDFAEWMADNRACYASAGDAMRDYFSDALGDVSDSDKLETMAALFRIAGIPALCTSSRGYSQGDYAELLIVAPWEAAKAFGWRKAKWRKLASNPGDMEAQARLYGYWAWGDVYGYVCEWRASPADEWEDMEGHGSSVWGFYGDDPAESGLAEQAADAITLHIEGN